MKMMMEKKSKSTVKTRFMKCVCVRVSDHLTRECNNKHKKPSIYVDVQSVFFDSHKTNRTMCTMYVFNVMH